MISTNRIIRPFIAALTVGLLIALLIPLATHSSQAAQSAAAAGPIVTGFKGVAEGQTIQGKAVIEAIVPGSNLKKVVFQLVGPQSRDYIDRSAPYYLMGDDNGTPRGWNTANYPNGAYTLTATATDQANLTGSATIHFKVANGVQPPTPTATKTPTQPPAPTATPTTAPGNETPVKGQTCPAWVHDRYTVAGPDGKQYPTWHAPVDPQYGCYFGHEHGDDPRTSVLFNEVGMPPFGYVNAIEGQRKEDHVGNKVYVVNDDTRGGSLLVKLHQGTHSADAFVNNLHELQYHYRNRDGRRLDIMILSAFGPSGQMKAGCGAGSGQVVQTGTATNNLGLNGGARIIPNAACFSPQSLPYEDWLSGNHITRANGSDVAYFDPHFAVFNPSRYYAPGSASNLGRSVELCQSLSGSLRAECQFAHDNPSLTWDSPSSPFKGEKREMYVNQNWITNSAGPNVWYCDPYGHNASTQPFAGAVPQYISASNYTQVLPSLVFGANINHNAPGVHSPN